MPKIELDNRELSLVIYALLEAEAELKSVASFSPVETLLSLKKQSASLRKLVKKLTIIEVASQS